MSEWVKSERLGFSFQHYNLLLLGKVRQVALEALFPHFSNYDNSPSQVR